MKFQKGDYVRTQKDTSSWSARSRHLGGVAGIVTQRVSDTTDHLPVAVALVTGPPELWFADHHLGPLDERTYLIELAAHTLGAEQ